RVLFRSGALRPLHDPAPQAWFDLPALHGAALRSAMVERNPLSAACALFARAAALAVGGFDVSLRVAQDYDLWLKLASLGELRCSAERRVQVRWHGDNQSAVVTAASEAERAYALVSALVRDGLGAFTSAPTAAARLELLRALARSGLREVHPFLRTLALEIHVAGEVIPHEPLLAGLRGVAPELFRTEPWPKPASAALAAAGVS
ncbi:MAG: hypothetical protein VCC00_01285, partial [Deltaproteobacteria bacterium]